MGGPNLPLFASVRRDLDGVDVIGCGGHLFGGALVEKKKKKNNPMARAAHSSGDVLV